MNFKTILIYSENKILKYVCKSANKTRETTLISVLK